MDLQGEKTYEQEILQSLQNYIIVLKNSDNPIETKEEEMKNFLLSLSETFANKNVPNFYELNSVSKSLIIAMISIIFHIIAISMNMKKDSFINTLIK